MKTEITKAGWLVEFFYGLSNFVSYLMQNHIYIYIFILVLVGKMFADGLIGRGSIPGRVIPKIQNMVLDAALLSTQH